MYDKNTTNKKCYKLKALSSSKSLPNGPLCLDRKSWIGPQRPEARSVGHTRASPSQH